MTVSACSDKANISSGAEKKSNDGVLLATIDDKNIYEKELQSLLIDMFGKI